jgi:hypothetical protein
MIVQSKLLNIGIPKAAMHAQRAWVATGDNKGRVQKINVAF